MAFVTQTIWYVHTCRKRVGISPTCCARAGSCNIFVFSGITCSAHHQIGHWLEITKITDAVEFGNALFVRNRVRRAKTAHCIPLFGLESLLRAHAANLSVGTSEACVANTVCDHVTLCQRAGGCRTNFTRSCVASVSYTGHTRPRFDNNFVHSHAGVVFAKVVKRAMQRACECKRDGSIWLFVIHCQTYHFLQCLFVVSDANRM